jgi:hypothetical protein
MANTRKVSLRPKDYETRAETVSERPDRQKLRENFRNILTVDGKSPDYEYRWILDTYGRTDDEQGKYYPGQRILKFQQLGWDFVKHGEVTVGEAQVYKTENIGSLVRVPAGRGEYQYLMKIKKEWYDEDQKIKQKEVDELEGAIGNPQSADGQYGNVSIGEGSIFA